MESELDLSTQTRLGAISKYSYAPDCKVAWTSLVLYAETKWNLNIKELYEEALGQISDRSQLLFGIQPHRKHVMSIALGPTSLEVVCLSRDPDQQRLRRSGLLPLSQSSTIPSSAARMLLRLFFTPAHMLDYREPLFPAPFVTTSTDGLTYQLDKFECLRASDGPVISGRIGAYKAQTPDGQSVVIKFGNDVAIRHEVWERGMAALGWE